MSHQPLVSVVIPCYNHEMFVQDCIQSVIDQTYQNIELIIIDDGSSDGSVAKIQKMVRLCEERFTNFEFRHRPNKGLSATLNESIEWCQGEYFSCIASDDKILRSKIQLQVEYFTRTFGVVAVFGGVDLIDERGSLVGEWVTELKTYNFIEIFMHQHFLLAPTALISMEALQQVNGYKSGMIIEDWYMWLKLSKLGEIHTMPNKVAHYRMHEWNTSKNLEKMHQGRFQVINEFKTDFFYEKAKLNVQWINASEYLRVNKIKALKCYFKIMIKSPNFFFKNFLNRLYNRI